MSEEEKQAIESLKKLKVGIEILNSLGNSLNSTDFEKDIEDIKAIDTVLNLIDRQQKEKEELHKECNKLVNPSNLRFSYFDNKGQTQVVIYGFVSKDKIKAKMQEIISYTYNSEEEKLRQEYAYDRLKELLGDKEDE